MFFNTNKMESSNVGHAIKKRESPRDVFITPPALALSQIKFSLGDKIDEDLNIEYKLNKNTKVLDPCCHSIDGSYIKHMRDLGFDYNYCEITMDKDFFEHQGRDDGLPYHAIIGNPPYSMLDKWFKKSVELNPQIISYIIGQGNLTAKRIEFMNKNGYVLEKVKMLKVWKWYGMSYIVHFRKWAGEINPSDNCIEIEDVRKVWR